MLYNTELTRKLRYTGLGLSAFFFGYAFLGYADDIIGSTRLIIIILAILLSVIWNFRLKKPTKKDYIFYVVSILAVMNGLLFRSPANLIIDVTLLLVTVTVTVMLGIQTKKADQFA